MVTTRYDVLKATDLLYLLPDVGTAFRTLRPWVTPHGYLFATVPLCTEVGPAHYWRGGVLAWTEVLRSAGWGLATVTPLGGRWTLCCHLLDTLLIPKLSWLARRLATLAIRFDTRWPSGWVIGYGIMARPILREDEPGPGFRHTMLTEECWTRLGFGPPYGKGR